MNELSLHQRQMVDLDRERARLSVKLRELRSIMRENGIGHLYPGTTPEHEKEVQAAAKDSDNYFILQRTAWQYGAEMEAWKRIAHNIAAWLQLNYPDIRAELPDELLNTEVAMELNIKKLITSKRGVVINGSAIKPKGLINE